MTLRGALHRFITGAGSPLTRAGAGGLANTIVALLMHPRWWLGMAAQV